MLTISACFVTGVLCLIAGAVFTLVLFGGLTTELYDDIAERDATIADKDRTIGILRNTLNRTPGGEVIPLRRA